NDLLLLLGYTPAPDELIGQATIHKALAEHDAQVRAEYAERHAEAHRQQVLLLMGDKDKLKVERDRAESALAEAQKLIRKLRDAMEDIRSFAPSNQRNPAA